MTPLPQWNHWCFYLIWIIWRFKVIKTYFKNYLQILIDPGRTESPSTCSSLWSEDVTAEWAGPALQAGPDGWLAAVGSTASSLSTTIRPICLQFPHSSTAPSEVHSDPVPTPPQQSTALYVHCSFMRPERTRAYSQDQLPCPPTYKCTCRQTCTCAQWHTHTHTRSHTHSLSPLINFSVKQKQADTHEEDVKGRFLQPGED